MRCSREDEEDGMSTLESIEAEERQIDGDGSTDLRCGFLEVRLPSHIQVRRNMIGAVAFASERDVTCERDSRLISLCKLRYLLFLSSTSVLFLQPN